MAAEKPRGIALAATLAIGPRKVRWDAFSTKTAKIEPGLWVALALTKTFLCRPAPHFCQDGCTVVLRVAGHLRQRPMTSSIRLLEEALCTHAFVQAGNEG